jgi:hypothetical protein
MLVALLCGLNGLAMLGVFAEMISSIIKDDGDAKKRKLCADDLQSLGGTESTREPNDLDDLASEADSHESKITWATRLSASSRSNKSKGKSKLAKNQKRLQQMLESRGVQWVEDFRQTTAAAPHINKFKEEMEEAPRVDMFSKWDECLWSMPTNCQKLKDIPAGAVMHITERCSKDTPAGKMCLMCKKLRDANHDSSQLHLQNARQMVAFDEVLGVPTVVGGVRNMDSSLLRPPLPMNQAQFKAHWGGTPECLIEACLTQMKRTGILVRTVSSKPQQLIKIDKVKSAGLHAVTYAGVHESKYTRHFTIDFQDIPESSEHGATAIQILPPESGFWPVVCLDFEEDYTWEESIVLSAEMGELWGVPPGTVVIVCWVWVCCVWQVWWDTPTAWPVRRIMRIA